MRENTDKWKLTHLSGGELMLVTDSGKIKLAENTEDDFDLCAYPGGKMDIFAASKDGSLMHISYSEGEVNTKVMLKSRSGDSRVCCIKVLNVNSHIHLFYCIRRSENILVHQIFHVGTVSEPQVIDRVSEKMIYSVCADDEYNLHIIYTDQAGTTKYTKYKNSSKSRISSVVITQTDVRSVSIIANDEGIYGAFTLWESSGASIYVSNVTEGKFLCAVKRVGTHTKTFLVPDDSGFVVKWSENSMCFGVRCTYNMEISGVMIFGKSGDAVKLRCERGIVCADTALCTPSGKIADIEKLYQSPRAAIPKPKGFEAEEMSRKYLGQFDVSTKGEQLMGEFARLEASLEKIAVLLEKSLSLYTQAKSRENNYEEESK